LTFGPGPDSLRGLHSGINPSFVSSMLRVLFIILAVVFVALAIVLDQPLLYLLAFALLIAAGLLVTLGMRKRHNDVPETFMQAPEQPDEDLASLGILDIKPRVSGAGQEVSSEDQAKAGEEDPANVESEQSDSLPTTVDRSIKASAAQAHVAGVSKARTRPKKARIMVSEASSETKADVLVPCLKSLRASLDAHTVCLVRQEDVPLRYEVEVMISQNSYARSGGIYSAKEPMLSGHRALIPVVYPRIGPNGFPKAKLGYYHEPINIRQVAIVPVVPKQHDELFLLVVDTLHEDGLEAASVRILLEQYARLVTTILETLDTSSKADEASGAPRPRREIIADEMEQARTLSHPLSLALVYLNKGEALSGDGVGDIQDLEDQFESRLRSVALDARIERFGELTFGIFYHGDHDSLADWASGIKDAFPEEEKIFEGGVSIGVAPFQERHDAADELRSEATAALQESFESGECVIVG
jgi:hypothetical protein